MNRTLNNLLLSLSLILFVAVLIGWNVAADERTNVISLAVFAVLYFVLSFIILGFIAARPDGILKKIMVSFLRTVC